MKTSFNYRAFIFLSVLMALLTACETKRKQQRSFIAYVDPYIGSGGHGHVFVGASVPFGGVQAGPSNFNKGWDWCSAYHYSDSIVKGFAQLHLSGTGISDLSDILIMPTVGDLKIKAGSQAHPEKGYASFYSHDKETVEPGYYSLILDDYNIKVEVTTSKRVAFYRYTYPEAEKARLIIDLEQGNCETATDTYFEQINDSVVAGYRFSTGWAENQKEYFALQLSKPIKELLIYDDTTKQSGSSARGKAVKAALEFSTKAGEQVFSKVGISPVSMNNALQNIRAEIPHWNFQNVRDAAQKEWNAELAKIKITTKNECKKRIFYTALYHTMIAPNLFDDVNGQYRGMDGRIHQNKKTENYSLFSLWDTYRATHPLFTIIQQERVPDMVTSMLNIYKQQGKLPIWHLRGNETNTMVGYSAVPVVVDAVLKGFPIDKELAYEAVCVSATEDFEPGIRELKQYGYIPADSMPETVARSMEYAISDHAIAQLAKALGKEKDAVYFTRRSKAYRYYFDKKDQFMKGKMRDGTFRTPFDPVKAEHRTNDYCEGNAWQYIWLVPHDPVGLMALFGGEKPFVSKLDSLFSISSELGEEASADITGMIGQYAHGNEPSHHTTYLYAYAGQQYKTADKVRFIMDSLYTDKPDGLSGNEDCGQMSAWYVMSALGFYSVNPSSGVYVFGSPLFDEAEVKVAHDKTFRIVAKNNSDKNIYIQSAKLNRKPYHKSYLTHADMMQGGTLLFKMGDTPNPDFGAAKENRPQ